MADIVERLRACADDEIEHTKTERNVDVPQRWCREAAGEIERLREALRKTAGLAGNPDAWFSEIEHTARDALKETP
jgi:hypothetical protein